MVFEEMDVDKSKSIDIDELIIFIIIYSSNLPGLS